MNEKWTDNHNNHKLSFLLVHLQECASDESTTALLCYVIFCVHVYLKVPQGLLLGNSGEERIETLGQSLHHNLQKERKKSVNKYEK